MLTDQDIEKLRIVVREELLPTNQKVEVLQQDVDSLRETVQALSVAVDKLVKLA